MSRFTTRLAALLSLVLACSTPSALAAESVRVFAAASLTDAMQALSERYAETHDVRIVPVFASSSTLARQIAQGAPADVYLSANEKWMDWLEQQPGVVLDARADLLGNRLALIAPEESALEPFTPDAAHPLAQVLGNGRLAVGDPDHVPAGMYAREALERLGQWETLGDRLARADNVRAALALVERNEAPLGIVYATDARASDAIIELGLFPADSHTPITYPVALVGETPGKAARDFRKWLEGEEAAEVFQAQGFETREPSADR